MYYILHYSVQLSKSYYSPATALKLYESDSMVYVHACDWYQKTFILFFCLFGRTMKEVPTLTKCYYQLN